MIGLDTNILVRYIAQDNPVQSAQATAIFEQILNAENPGFVSLPAMVETVWVLEKFYGMAGAALAAVIEGLLQESLLAIEREVEVFTAMFAVRDGKGSFADALIAALGTRAGCSHTLTLDRKAVRLPGMALP